MKELFETKGVCESVCFCGGENQRERWKSESASMAQLTRLHCTQKQIYADAG